MGLRDNHSAPDPAFPQLLSLINPRLADRKTERSVRGAGKKMGVAKDRR